MTRICLALIWVLSCSSSTLPGVEIPGKVYEVNGAVVRLKTMSGFVPNTGDKVEIFFEIPNVKARAKIASGKVTEVDGPNILVKLDGVHPKSKVVKDQFATIFSDKAVKTGTTPGAPGGPFVLDVRERLAATDGKDTVRTGSFKKLFSVNLAKGNTYVIDMISTELDSYLRLEDAAGKQLAFDDDSGGNLNARITFTPETSGVYRVIGTTYAGGATGNFQVTVKNLPPAQMVLDVRDRLVNTDGKDTVRTASFRKVFNVNLEKGQAYVIDMISTDLDSYLRLENAAGAQLAADDDSGGNLNARIIFTPQTTGIHRIIATTFVGGASGNFQLKMTRR